VGFVRLPSGLIVLRCGSFVGRIGILLDCNGLSQTDHLSEGTFHNYRLLSSKLKC